MKKLMRLFNAKLEHEFSKLNFGPVIEEGLLIGVSIAALLILISVVLAILDNTTSLFNELTDNGVLG